jgi:hypothetical protein
VREAAMERVLALMSIYFVWVLAPMIPSIVIYWLFPDTAVGVKGVLASLTVSAAGAFAAYLILFVVASPLIDKIVGALDPEQVWTIEGRVKLVDETGKTIKNSLLADQVSVQLNPSDYDITPNGFRLRVVKRQEQLPYVTVHIPNFGDGNIDPTQITDIGKIDYSQHIIQLSSPVVIQRESTMLRDPTHPFGP